MRGVIHLKHSQDRNALSGGDSFVRIVSVMSARECDRYQT
jgi:hypothetical protein